MMKRKMIPLNEAHIWVDEGWHNLIKKLVFDIKELIPEEAINILQVKEKFGGLRFYVGTSYEYSEQLTQQQSIELNEKWNKILKLIDLAEEKSYITCMICGEKGKIRKGGWLVTLCDICFNKGDKGDKG